MKKYYGNYLGIVVNGSYGDPENRNRVQVWVPHVTNTLYANWNSGDLEENKGFSDKSIFDLENSNIDEDLLTRIRNSLPWAECAAPLIGRGSTYYRNEETRGQSVNPVDKMVPDQINLGAVPEDIPSEPAPSVNGNLETLAKESGPLLTKEEFNNILNNAPPQQQSPAAYNAGDVENNIAQINQPLSRNAASYISNTPWSAGFISYVAGSVDKNFSGAGLHTAYASSVRNGNVPNWVALDPKNTPVRNGDIIIKNRAGNSLSYNSNWSGASHGDIVTSVSNGVIKTVGGNVGNSVSITNVNATNGVINSSGYFAILRPPSGIAANIAASAEKEYLKWSTNNWRETSSGALNTISSYYAAGKLSIPDGGNPEQIDSFIVNDESSPIEAQQIYTANAPVSNGGYDGTATGTYSSPDVGAKVWVFFMGGDIQKPVYFAMSLNSANYQQTYQSS
jgi:hypothetical protein